MHDRSNGIVAAALAASLFGSAYVATAFQLHGFTPLGAALWRAGLATIVLLVLSVANRLLRPAPADRPAGPCRRCEAGLPGCSSSAPSGGSCS